MNIKDIDRTTNEVRAERFAQERRWGEQNHSPMEWLSILVEEVGEACQAANKAHWNDASWNDASWNDYRTELVQVAAVACAAIECLDRHGGHP